MWTIWYTDTVITGLTFDDWVSAPDEGVICVHQLIDRIDDVNVGHICMGSDWYWMSPDGSIGESLCSSDVPGVWLECDKPAGAHVKSGIWTTDERMIEVHADLKRLIED